MSGPETGPSGESPKAEQEKAEIRNVSQKEFEQIKTRIEKFQRIADDLCVVQVGQLKSETKLQREEELNMIEFNSKQGAEKGQLQEVVLDVRGANEKHKQIIYRSPGGKEIQEEFIYFEITKEGAIPKIVKDSQGDIRVINSDQYKCARLSKKHNQGFEYRCYTLPRVDGRGAYIGIVSLFVDKK